MIDVGIELKTCGFEVQRLNHCITAELEVG